MDGKDGIQASTIEQNYSATLQQGPKYPLPDAAATAVSSFNQTCGSEQPRKILRAERKRLYFERSKEGSGTCQEALPKVPGNTS